MFEKKIAFEATGTQWEIELPEMEIERFKKIKQAIRERVELFEATYSRFRSDSLLAKMAKKKGKYSLPPDAKDLLDMYEKVYQASNGLVTPLIGKTLVQAGYDASYSLTPKKLSKVPAWEEIIDYHFPILEMKKAYQLDFGGLGKGYLIDLVGNLIESKGIKNYVIDAGRDILYKTAGNREMVVGLEHPLDLGQVLGEVRILNKSICGSAGNRRRWRNFHHIINPSSLSSPTEVIAVWTVADTALMADAMASAVYFCEPTKLRQFDFEYLRVKADLSFEVSANWPGRVY